MTVTTTTRLGLTRWSADSDPITRPQMDASHAALEAKSVIFDRGTLAARGAAGTVGRFYEVTDAVAEAPTLFWDNGSAWVEIRPDLTGYATDAALTSGLAGKAASVHTHTRSQITDFAHSHVLADLQVVTIEGSSLVVDVGGSLR